MIFSFNLIHITKGKGDTYLFLFYTEATYNPLE